ncbi:hypothetical protein MHZ92_20245 [Sporosarcina sp. ACRSL]|uniref:hypothetical protein n=1 Tax=Sporosarcina sp. ACRSL TaxID=2918215 RepID=UPI001EF427F0|nr:hypothetical protein [Sporosarcina sp. ACRSL]MCG7346439.1 hypothetical protein [Sporosarcina sp. ACRSL]
MNKSWKITFDRALTEGDKVDIRINRSGRDVPILTETKANEIIVTPIRNYFPIRIINCCFLSRMAGNMR